LDQSSGRLVNIAHTLSPVHAAVSGHAMIQVFSSSLSRQRPGGLLGRRTSTIWKESGPKESVLANEEGPERSVGRY
jgi:hypothetical protein